MKYDSYLFFPSVYWSFNWERQHELIYRFAGHLKDAQLQVFQPFGMVNHRPVEMFFRIYCKLRERKTSTDGSSNRTRDNINFVFANYIPVYGNSAVAEVNYLLLKKRLRGVRLKDSFVWATYVNDFTLKVFQQGKVKVLDLAARRQVQEDLPDHAKEVEIKAVRIADVVVVDNISTYNDYKGIAKSIHYIPQGVDPGRFLPEGLPSDLSALKEGNSSTVVGYCGALHRYMDYPVLHRAIQALPEFKFVFVGNILDERAVDLQKHPNVIFTGRKTFDELHLYYNLFDVGLIPYTIEPFTTGVFPTKFFEYLAGGTPVCTSALPDLVRYAGEHIRIYDSEASLIASIRDLAGKKKSASSQLKELAVQNSWTRRFNDILDVIGI